MKAATHIVAPKGERRSNLVNSGRLVRVDTVEAIRDDSYFLRKIEASLQ